MKRIALAALLAVIALAPIASMADPLPDTPAGAVHAHQTESGGEIYADGAAGNPDPLDGYAGVEIGSDGTVTPHCSDQGDWNDQDGDGVADADEEPAQARTGCNP